MDAARIRQVVAARYTKKLWAVHFEVGLCKGGRLRSDVLALNMGGGIDVVEVKSSVADFKSDKKWEGYRRYCDKLYFAFSKEVYTKVKDLIPKGVGIYVVSENSIYVAQRASYKAVHAKTRLNLVTRVAYRTADATRFQRKSKTAGRRYIANTVIDAVKAMPKPKTEAKVRQVAYNSLEGIV